MKSGIILHRFKAKDGRKVVLRTPKWEDLDDYVELFNSLVDTEAEIVTYQKLSREENADWLTKRLTALEKDEELSLVAETEEKVVGNVCLVKGKGITAHTGEIKTMIVKNSYQDIGIGTQILEKIIECAKEMGLKTLYLWVLSTNPLAYHVYQKAGFRETGRKPRFFYRNGRYIDDIMMFKEIFLEKRR